MQFSRLVCAIVATSLISVIGLVGCSSEQVAAKYDNGQITENQVTEYTQQFRNENSLTDDESWVQYLTNSGIESSVWRENVIRQLVEHRLIEEKAKELGVVADSELVNRQISADKQQAGISEDDEAAWESYLSELGKTPQSVREAYGYSSVEQQVFAQELDLTEELEEEMCDEYISNQLSDQIVHRYHCVVFEKKSDAQDYLKSIRSLNSDELVDEIQNKAGAMDTELSSGARSGDTGWDFIFSEGVIDPDIKLRKSDLASGELYNSPLKGSDGYRVVVCTGRGDFYETPTYSKITDDDLKALVKKLTLASTWASKCQTYLNDLVDSVNVQVAQMPDGLPYDIVEDDVSGSE